MSTQTTQRRLDGALGDTDRDSTRRFVTRVWVVVGIVAAVAVSLALAWYAADVLLLIFGGVLLAVFLRALTDSLSKFTRLPTGWALAIVILLLAAVISLGGWRIAGRVSQQIDQLIESVPASFAEIEGYLGQYAWGRRLLERAPSADQLILGRTDVLARVTGFFSTVLGSMTTVIIVLFVGLYAAIDPGIYRRGAMHLVPLGKRRRAEQVLDALSSTLRWWLLGRLLSMVVVSIATTVGLWLLGIPAALALGSITFLFVFIPYLGPFLAAAPAILFALSLKDATAPLYVALLYLGIQMLEGYLLTPIVQSRTIRLPPVLTLAAQMLMGVLFGLPGIVLATPLAAVVMVLVKMLYVEDALGDPIGQRGASS